MPDLIEIRRLRVSCHIGVPDAERATPQNLFVSVKMAPTQGFTGLADEIANSVDYYAVSIALEALTAARPRRLIETLACDISDYLLGNYPLAHVEITIEKHILPNTECVAVHLHRSRSGS